MIDFNPIHYELSPIPKEAQMIIEVDLEVDLEFLELDIEVNF